MSSLKNCKKNLIPSSLFKKYLYLYKTIGLMDSTIEYLVSKYQTYLELTNKDNIYYFYKIFFSDSKLKESRIKQYIDKKTGEYTKNNEEIILKNIVRIFDLIDNGAKLRIDTEEFRNLANQFVRGTKINNFFKKNNKGELSYIDRLDIICKEYLDAIKDDSIESIYAACSMLVDFMYLSPFNYFNDEIGIIMFYAILKTTDIKSFNYYSFFKVLYERKQDFDKAILNSYHLIDQNLNNCFDLLCLVLDICLESYDKIKELKNNITYDKQLKKHETVETVIYKLPVYFSKQDIMNLLPDISMTTVDRCLKRLSEEGKIAAWGKGRNAKWVRLDKTYDNEINFDN